MENMAGSVGHLHLNGQSLLFVIEQALLSANKTKFRATTVASPEVTCTTLASHLLCCDCELERASMQETQVSSLPTRPDMVVSCWAFFDASCKNAIRLYRPC